MNGYELSRKWFNYSFENPEKIKPVHSAIYFFAIELCNRLGWKENFSFPTTMVMEAIGVKSYNTYKKSLDEVVEFGFIEMKQRSKNQFSANIIALSNFDKAITKALDNAIITQDTKQVETINESIVSVDKQETNKPSNKKTRNEKFNFRKSLIALKASKNLVDDWLAVRKTKKGTNTETAFDTFISEVDKSGKTIDEILKICINKDWRGFNNSWLQNINQTDDSSGRYIKEEITNFKFDK